MKKSLLSMALAVCTATGVMADSYTLDFSGTNDMAGLTRQSSTKLDDLTFVESVNLTENGIDFSLISSEGEGKGFALVNAGGTKAGIFVSPKITPQITLTVPNGKITGAKLFLTGYALSALEVSFNGTKKEASSDSSLYFWSWEDAENGETLTITWPQISFELNNVERYIHKIELTYTQDLGGKKEPGLAFSAPAAEGFIGETFIAPELSNPNNLPIIWSSSDDAIASVDAEGNVTLKSGGKAFITAATDGNDEFGAGSVRYEVTSIPVADTLAKMLQDAPASGDPVKVNCPLTVTYAKGSNAYVIDAENTAGYIHDARFDGDTNAKGTIYNVGDVVPAGWLATHLNVIPNSSTFYWSGRPEKVTETVEVTYPEVKTISPEDNNRVVTLMNVKFEKRTPTATSREYGTTPDGSRYEFQDTFDIGEKDPGTYDVTGVVLYSEVGSTTYFWMAPISYAESKDEPGPGPGSVETIETDDTAKARYFNLQGIEVSNPENGIFVKVTGGKATKEIIR